MILEKPSTSDYAPFYNTYVSLINTNDIVDEIYNQKKRVIDLLNGITDEKATYAYSEGKWSIKTLMQHVIDAERIFSYRMLCIARGESTSLPSFDENPYAENSHANERAWDSLVNEFLNLRLSTIDLIKSFNKNDFKKTGVINNYQITVLSLAYIIAGHTAHHCKIISERYLPIA